MSRAVLCAVALLLPCGLASAQQRVALVIGNGNYSGLPALANPLNDANDVGAAFQRLGFAVERVNNASFDGMRRALISFGHRARNAEIAIVYFAGHGMEIGGENWLLPVDAQLRTDLDVEHEAVGLKSVILAVSSASKLGLVVLDACRNNPFAAKMARTTRTRAVSRGLTRVEPAGSVLVVYAAKDGTTAADGNTRNSPFTTALLRYIEKPELEINFLFRNVRDDVLAMTRQEQEPYVYGSLSRQAIYLAALPPGSGAPAAAGVPAAVAPAQPTASEPLAASTAPPAPAKSRLSIEPAYPGGKCFVFNQRRYCV